MRLVWLALLSLVACVHVSPRLTNGPGWTDCMDGRPVTHWDASADPSTVAEMDVHEAVHRAQLAGDCEARLAWLTATVERRAEAEAEAGCVQLAWAAPDATRWTFDLGQLRGWLYVKFPTLTHDSLNAAITRWCAAGARP